MTENGTPVEGTSSTTDVQTDQSVDHAEKKDTSKGVQKLLSQRNEAKAEAEKYKSMVESEEFQNFLDQQLNARERKKELDGQRKKLAASVTEDDLKAVEAIMERTNNTLSYEEAYKLHKPSEFV